MSVYHQKALLFDLTLHSDTNLLSFAPTMARLKRTDFNESFKDD